VEIGSYMADNRWLIATGLNRVALRLLQLTLSVNEAFIMFL
jgi:hypothetical protein